MMNKKNESFLGKKKAFLPRTAQSTIPFREAYENGLFLNYDGSYSLIFSFENIDYTLFRDEEKQEIYEKYTHLLNSIPPDVQFQEFMMNTEIDINIMRKALLPYNQEFPEISEDYNSIMNNFISNSSSTAAKKIMIMAMSYKPNGNIDNANVLFKYYQDFQSLFSNLGSSTKQLFPNDIFEILYKFYHQFSIVPFMMPKNPFAAGGKSDILPHLRS